MSTSSSTPSTKKLIKHTALYVACECLVMAGGFISFPILTRLLTVEEYCLMSVVTMTIAIITEFFSGGLKHSIMRFHPQYTSNKDMELANSTLIITSLALGVIGASLTIICSYLMVLIGIVPQLFFQVIKFATILIIIREISEIIGSIFRATSKPKFYVFFTLLNKYLGLAFSVFFVISLTSGIVGLYQGLIIGELLVVLYYIFFSYKKLSLTAKFSSTLVRNFFSFGFPLTIAGFARTFLNVGDRYLLSYFMSLSDVALYSVPYNLCSYINAIIVQGFHFAFYPIIMKMWGHCPEAQISSKFTKVIRIYCFLIIPIALITFIAGENIIVLLSSDKYAASSKILPYILIGEMIGGLVPLFTYGFRFHQLTKEVSKLTWYAAILNVMMNCVLIPRLGLFGAVYSTLVSYIFLFLFSWIRSFKLFKFEIPWKDIILYIITATAVYVLIKMISTKISITMLTTISFSLACYFMITISLDRQIRLLFEQALIALREKVGNFR